MVFVLELREEGNHLRGPEGGGGGGRYKDSVGERRCPVLDLTWGLPSDLSGARASPHC